MRHTKVRPYPQAGDEVIFTGHSPYGPNRRGSKATILSCHQHEVRIQFADGFTRLVHCSQVADPQPSLPL